MTLLVDIAHMILAATLSFLGLGYERAQDAHAIQLTPQQVHREFEGALLSPASLSVSVQNAQSLCSPNMIVATNTATSEGLPPRATAQVIILNDCETITRRPALPTL